MASVENTEAVEFNRGEAISSSWPYGRSGASTDPVTHFAVCADQHGESVRVMSPFSVPLVLPRGNPVTFGPRSLSIVDIHNIRRGLWNDNPERGEKRLEACLYSLEAIIGQGNTLGPTPQAGSTFVSLHRDFSALSSLATALAVDGTSLMLSESISSRPGDFFRVEGNSGAPDEVVRMVERVSDRLFAVERGQPDINGVDTSPTLHDAGNMVWRLNGPGLSTELINAGNAFPASPTPGERFIFTEPADITNAFTSANEPLSRAFPGSFFVYHQAGSWVLQVRRRHLLTHYGAAGYCRVEIVREPRQLNGVPTRYSNIQSFLDNESGWTLSRGNS